MSKYIPTAEIPERGNVLSVPYEFLFSIRMMPDDDRLAFVTAQIDWIMDGVEPNFEGRYRTLFDRWRGYQNVQADNARKTQERARAAIAKRWHKMPPPTR